MLRRFVKFHPLRPSKLTFPAKRNMSEHKLCMIPGPVEFDSQVLSAMSSPDVDPAFVETFGNSLELLRKVFLAPTAQPFVVAGSGTLTWDMTAA
jgi:alanine-glyoxylate transaminase / serine-glyoxylate transaminase / serine-pyruvate transaminase